MARTFFRIQTRGIELAEMQQHNSQNGAGDEEHEGLCAADSVSALRHYISGWMLGDTTDFEIVIFEGQKVGEVYDGVLTYPERIIERVSVDEFLADDRVCELENW